MMLAVRQREAIMTTITMPPGPEITLDSSLRSIAAISIDSRDVHPAPIITIDAEGAGHVAVIGAPAGPAITLIALDAAAYPVVYVLVDYAAGPHISLDMGAEGPVISIDVETETTLTVDHAVGPQAVITIDVAA